jgi:hypothetical protein
MSHKSVGCTNTVVADVVGDRHRPSGVPVGGYTDRDGSGPVDLVDVEACCDDDQFTVIEVVGHSGSVVVGNGDSEIERIHRSTRRGSVRGRTLVDAVAGPSEQLIGVHVCSIGPPIRVIRGLPGAVR